MFKSTKTTSINNYGFSDSMFSVLFLMGFASSMMHCILRPYLTCRMLLSATCPMLFRSLHFTMSLWEKSRSKSALLNGMASRDSANCARSLKACSPLLSLYLKTSTQRVSAWLPSLLAQGWNVTASYYFSSTARSPGTVATLRRTSGEVCWNNDETRWIWDWRQSWISRCWCLQAVCSELVCRPQQWILASSRAIFTP